MTHLRNEPRLSIDSDNPGRLRNVPDARVVRPDAVTSVYHVVRCDCEGEGCQSPTHRHQEIVLDDNGAPIPDDSAERTYQTRVVEHPCNQEHLAFATEPYEWFVPAPWKILAPDAEHPEGRHLCPDCHPDADAQLDLERSAGAPHYKLAQHALGIVDHAGDRCCSNPEHRHVDQIVDFGAGPGALREAAR